MVLFIPNRKFSFITMKTEEQADAAIAGLHGRVVLGQPLTVERAEEKGDNPKKRKRDDDDDDANGTGGRHR